MSIAGVSETLENVVYSKMKNGIGSTYELDLTFTQSTAGLEIKPVEIQGIIINQLFAEQAIDQIGCRCTFFPLDLYNILSNTQDLKLTIIQRRWERKYYSTLPDEEPDIYTFKVLIENPQDLMKQIPPAAIKKTEETNFEREQIKTPIPLDMQLVPDKDFEMMKSKGGAPLADVDVQSVILYMCNLWGIENTSISPPDNTKKYENFFIPALIKFNEFIPWLQGDIKSETDPGPGIYSKGAAAYFCNDTWYIYPPFDTDPERNEVVNIFKLPENSVDGGDVYHNLEGDDLYITSFSKVQGQSMAQQATENVGNAVAVRQADSSMDIPRDLKNDGTIILNNESTIIAKVNSSATAVANETSIEYGGTTANIFAKLSEMAAGQIEIITLGWIHAKPWLIKPGMKCVLHYDDTSKPSTDKDNPEENFYTTTPGIVSAVKYTLVVQSQPADRIYRWDATIVLAVPPQEIDPAQTQQPTPNT